MYTVRLCDDCYWRVQCWTYDHLSPDEDVRKCHDEYGGIEYKPIQK